MKIQRFILVLIILSIFIYPVYSFNTFRVKGPAVHEEITSQAIVGETSAETFKIIDDAGSTQDRIGSGWFENPTHHFDDNEINGSLDYIDSQFVNAVHMAGDCDIKASYRDYALENMGHLFHTIQDFYAHSNYVELCLKKGLPLKPIIPFERRWNNKPSGLKTGYFYAMNTAFLSEATILPRAFCVWRLSSLYPHERFASNAERAAIVGKDYFQGALDYATGPYAVLHMDINKDKASTFQGALIDPASNRTLFDIAKDLAVQETRRWWDRFLNEVRKEYPNRADDLIAILRGQKAPGQGREEKEETEKPFEPVEKVKPLELILDISRDEVAPQQEVKVVAKVSGGTKPYKYSWALDGKIETESSRPFIRAKSDIPGEHIVILKVKDSSEPVQSVVDVITFNVRSFKVLMGADRLKTVPGKIVKITATPTGGEPPYEDYKWSLNGDAKPACKNSVVRARLNTPGTHEIKVSVKDSSQPSKTAEGAISIEVLEALRVRLEAQHLQITEGESAVVRALVSGGTGKYKYTWRLDNRRRPNRTESSVTALLSRAGDREIRVFVTDDNLPGVYAEAAIIIKVLPKEKDKPEAQPTKPKFEPAGPGKEKEKEPVKEKTPVKQEKLDFSVTVYDEAGKPIPKVRIEVKGPASAATVASGGKANFTKFPAGNYKIKALCAGYLVKEVPFKLASSKSKNSVSISLKKEKTTKAEPVILVGKGKLDVKPSSGGAAIMTKVDNNTEISMKIDVEKGTFSGDIGGSLYLELKIILPLPGASTDDEKIKVKSTYKGTHKGNYSGTAEIGTLTGSATLTENAVVTTPDGTEKKTATATGQLTAELNNGVVKGRIITKEAGKENLEFTINVHPE